MRIRSIKPEFWASEDIAALDWNTRLLFIGLWSYVDDNGVGRDNERLILADLFPLEDDPRDTLATVSRGLQALSNAGLIARYVVKGKPFLHITTWEAHQRIDRPGKPRYPAPTCDDAVSRDEDATGSRDRRDTPATGAVEQGNRGSREQGEGEQRSVGSATALTNAPRADVSRLCEHLADRIEGNGAKRPSIGKKWEDAARLMLDNDGRNEPDVHAAIDWCQDDEFWRANILSMPKLREKYDQLRMQAKRRNGPTTRAQETNDIFDRAARRMGVVQ